MNTHETDSFTARVEDLCERAEKWYAPAFTPFLTAEEQQLARRAASAFPQVFCLSFGGFENAERRKLGFFNADAYVKPENAALFDGVHTQTADTLPFAEDAEIAAVRIRGSGFRTWSHRDVLGSLMALGIRRETLGDIFVEDDGHTAYVITTEGMAPFLCDALTDVANDRVKTERIPREKLPEKRQQFADQSLTLASLRLDALVAAMLNLSRENAKKLLHSGAISLNHTVCTAVDKEFAAGDVISVRGHGKFLVDSFLGKTQKDRMRVIVRKYI